MFLHRRLSDRAIEEVAELLGQLQLVMFSDSDSLLWRDDSSEVFSLKVSHHKYLNFRRNFFNHSALTFQWTKGRHFFRRTNKPNKHLGLHLRSLCDSLSFFLKKKKEERYRSVRVSQRDRTISFG